ncbi:putative bifunctional enzyme with isomerase/decarboxylase activity (Includes:5-carboxymethyl-2-hydroxymuconate delta-isomerase/ 5-oxopent-3-ene-1,2,5-tricarboxylate decarboxylase) [Bradyrhizobium sp. ORS 375]|uniref:fumarylacetoacetate hydrolase family protein n=1 Tax=Bradyrhizobium sp. (strain ORS 375) TaxID=566679 RepID=UPI00024068F2|nr:fumarylacetoacetate hydrolase family protein [Bradyrhizobium sp. ORS 375]CCD91901.1 putative bifunctional enzyme with isomerase/decarboxylase activity (Includes:5-carboxymethyl-2-hydroxymuconate delta-isomerase/ 5-oxopent-3-ene-1,2,5-tricarboxylate decarboxylase) [Bradyrhizobium sp. ORS 375]
MKLVSFVIDGRAGYGAVKGDGVVDLGRRLPAKSLRALLEAGGLGDAAGLLASEQADYPLDAIAFAPVIPDPGKIICVGLNYRDHVAETGRTVTEKPALFARFPTSQVGHLQPIIRPAVSDHFDYEGELALVIGKAGRHVRREDALTYIAGYSCYNEGSIRDWQRHTSQFLSGKTFDKSGAFGPWLVTADEIPDPSRLTLQTRLNGETVQRTTTDLLITDVPDLIVYCSTIMTLLPGDVIVTGTPGGVGFKRSPPLFMKPGDTVEVEISGIGVLRNPVTAEAAA